MDDEELRNALNTIEVSVVVALSAMVVTLSALSCEEEEIVGVVLLPDPHPPVTQTSCPEPEL